MKCQYDEKEVIEATANSLKLFYDNLVAKIDTLHIKNVMKRKNPYLYRAKSMQSANDIVDSILSAFVSSSEETIFGNCFFEPIAITVSGGGIKAFAEGIDIMKHNKESNTMIAYAIKSGTSVFNADSKKRQSDNFLAARKKAQQAKASYEAIIGYGYGKKKKSNKGSPKIYIELAGQEFWTHLTGDDKFYLKLITYMGNLPELYVAKFNESYTKAKNRLLKEFTSQFCSDDGSIDWNKLVEFNSGGGKIAKT